VAGIEKASATDRATASAIARRTDAEREKRLKARAVYPGTRSRPPESPARERDNARVMHHSPLELLRQAFARLGSREEERFEGQRGVGQQGETSAVAAL